MDQQRSTLVIHIKCFSCLPLSLTYVISLSLISHLVDDRLLDA